MLNSDSYISRDDFFSIFPGKVLKKVRAQIYFSLYDHLFLSSFPLLKVRQTPLSNSKNIKVTKNVIDLYFRKWNLIFRFRSGIKLLPFDPVFSNWVNLIIKMSIINCSRNSKNYKGIFFCFKVRKLRLFQISHFFSV